MRVEQLDRRQSLGGGRDSDGSETETSDAVGGVKQKEIVREKEIERMKGIFDKSEVKQKFKKKGVAGKGERLPNQNDV